MSVVASLKKLRLLREPLFHFAAIGGLLFALYAAVAGPRTAQGNRIVVDSRRVEQLTTNYTAAWGQPPDADELRTLVDNYVREEIYYREALALGLDRDDASIRQRLRQKMEFLTDSGADLIEPSASELADYYNANAARFRDQSRIALEQVFLGENPSPQHVAQTLALLRSGKNADQLKLSDTTLLPAQVPPAAPAAIDSMFGTGFFDSLKTLPTGEWTGPLKSGYGMHLVRIDGTLPARQLMPGALRDVVLREWKAEKAEELRKQAYEVVRSRYEVELPANMVKKEP